MKTGFFAYSGYPLSAGECVEEAIAAINQKKETFIRSWKDFAINGTFIINEVTKAIDEADYFCADLTNVSDNVLFELGYAIGKNKPLFLVFDHTIIESFNKYKDLFFLKTLGHWTYTNSEHIIKGFEKRNVYQQNEGSFAELTRQLKLGNDGRPLLYLKNQINTNYSRKTADKIGNYFSVPCLIDDASESPLQNLSWYLEQLSNVPALLAEFSSTSRANYAIQNSKCSLICGLAYGLGRKFLIIVEDLGKHDSQTLYEVPIDYRDFLLRYNNQKSLDDYLTPFLSSVKDESLVFFKNLEFLNRKRTTDPSIVIRRTDLQNIDFGQFVAENENDRSYLDIFDLSSLVDQKYGIVIGRKGTGKTATLYSLADQLKQDSKNHVCLIQPVEIEIDGLLTVIENLSNSYQKTFFVQSTWKFIIYTEIVRSIYNKILTKHLAAYTSSEQKFVEFVNTSSSIFLSPLSDRLFSQLREIESQTSSKGDIYDFGIRISEIFHDGILSRAKSLLSDLFEREREKKIVVLIDNLDEYWDKGANTILQSSWILGLLGVVGNLASDLSGVKLKGSQKGINFNLTIFLRSDIFKYIRDNEAEPDKIDYVNLHWDDLQTLFRVIENRFVTLNRRDDVKEEELWENCIISSIGQQNIKNYIFERIMPRPRDLIYFFIQALRRATGRKHEMILEADIQSAWEDYSSWVFGVLQVESNKAYNLKDFLSFLTGYPNIISLEDIISGMQEIGLPTNENIYVENFIDYLASISVLGREVKNNVFKYEYGLDDQEVSKKRSKKLRSNRFKLHNCLIPRLELDCDIYPVSK